MKLEQDILMKHVTQLRIASPTDEQGIQEKFLKSSLGKDVALSKIDIQRHIVQTNMVGHIGVVDKTSEAMGLYLANAKQQYEKERNLNPHHAYPVAMMINCNPTGEPLWASAVITIDPQSKKASYDITSGSDLSKEQQLELSQTLNKAIKFTKTSQVTGLAIDAFPDIEIAEPEFKNADNGAYQVLHQLYNNERLADLVRTRDNAFAFKKVSPELVRQSIYDQQIQSIKIEPEVLNLFTANPQSQHSIVSEVLQDVKITDSKITFPRVKPETSLTSGDYQTFILLLKEKFDSSGIDTVLNELEIKCFDKEALQGLAQLKGQVQNLPFTKLILDLPEALEASDKTAFKFSLKLALMRLSESNLAKMQLHDAGSIFNEADITEITDFIEKNNIAVDLTLPGKFATSAYQRRVDIASSQSILNRNAHNFSQNDVMNVTPVTRPIRTRPELSIQNLSIDIELQQEVQVEVAVEASVEKSGQIENAEHDVELYNLENFKRALTKGDFSPESKSYLIPTGTGAEEIWTNWLGYFNADEAMHGMLLSKPALEELMRHAEKFQYGIGFLKKRDDYRNLPAGFTVNKTINLQTYIDFNPKLKLIAEPNLLAVQTKVLKPDAVLSAAQIKKWVDANSSHPFSTVWDDQLLAQKYDKQALHALQSALPQIAQMETQKAKELFELCKTKDKVDIAKLNFLVNDAEKAKQLLNSGDGQNAGLQKHIVRLFGEEQYQSVVDYVSEFSAVKADQTLLNSILSDEDNERVKSIKGNTDSINMNGLLQLYLQSGSEGLEKLSDRLENAGENLEIYKKIIANISKNEGSYQQILTDEFNTALNTYSGLPDNDRQFYTTLFEQHARHNSNVNFAELMHTFVKFKGELKELAQPSEELALPPECHLTDVKSMPLALARILELVRHVKQEDRQAQLLEAHKLDLSSSGMIYAVSKTFNYVKQWNFITQEMQLDRSHEQEKGKTYSKAYQSDCVRIGSKFFTKKGSELSKDFLRYVAFQSKKGSLGFEFYKHADDKIKNSSWSDKHKLYVYNLIAASATEESNIRFSKNTKEAIADFDALFKKINQPGVSVLIGENNLREEVLSSLNRLDVVPPLPVLNRLFSLISNSLSSGTNIIKNAASLKKANKRLHIMTKKAQYSDAVYKGMSYYQKEDYKQGKLFFEHMDTIEAIFEKSHTQKGHEFAQQQAGDFVINLISTFHLKKDNIDAVLSALQELHLAPKLELLKILTRIDTDKYLTLPPLSHQHLIALVKAVKEKDELAKQQERQQEDKEIENSKNESVMDIVKNFSVGGHKLFEYFDERYIQNYGKTQVPYNTKQQIEGAFDEGVRPVVEDILLNFTDNSDPDEYGTVVDKLISICSELPKPEKNLFLAKLNQAKGLYSDPTPLSDENNTFKALLELLEDQGSPDELLNFIASDKALFQKLAKDKKQIEQLYTDDPASNQGLDKKAVLFSRDIYPLIRRNKELPFSKLEITPRLHEWLLRTPVCQLTKDSAVIHPDSEQSQKYLEQSNKFSGALKEDAVSKTLDLTALEKALAELAKESDFPDKKVLKELQESAANIQKSSPISQKDAGEILNNKPVQELFLYLGDMMEEKEKAAFEKNHAQFIKKQMTKHRGLIANKALIPVLLDPSNQNLLQNTGKGDSLTALKSPDLLTNETIFNHFLTALEQDAEPLSQLKESATYVHKEVEQYQENLKKYPNVVLALVDKISAIAKENPSARGQFLELFDRFVEHYKPDQGDMMLVLHDFVDQLAPVFAKIKDKNVVLSLCMQFNGEEALQPEDLQALIKTINTNVKENNHQTLLINVAVNLLNNNKGYKLGDGRGNDFTKVCELAKEDKQFITTLETFYGKPPYPDLDQLIKIHEQAENEDDYNKTVQELAKEFDKKPCHRELEVNGFHVHVEEAIKQLQQFKGYTFTKDQINKFHAKTVNMKNTSSDDLLTILRKFDPDSNNPPNQDMETLVAVSAELLYRSKGTDAKESDGNYKSGSSMEINTTQYLAILSSLNTPGHVTCQIGTGEGKSRIMMISNICQWALGNTVDFVTSDAQLATRDYVEYQAYFNMVGAKTSMIFANSDTSAYQIGGINFSDPSNLSLFRNKAKSLGKGEQVLAPEEKRRALMLDEADKTYFDVADTRFNFSKEGDESIQNMSWVYPVLMDYFAQEFVNVDKSISSEGEEKMDPTQLFYKNVDASRESFLAFAGGKCSRQDFIRLKSLSEQQIEQWQVSAVTARELQFKKDFVISADQLISTPTGPKISSEAQLLFANRVAKGSKFSFGVQQCLHARLNRIRQNPKQIDNDDLKRALTSCEQGFYIADEKQIVYSSTSKNLIDDYREGTVKAVTGTAGSLIERAEASKLYKNMKFIDVPRAKGMIRQDKGMQLCKDEKNQLKTLIKNIKKAQANNQPILIIAENDEESGKLFELLQKDFSTDDIQRIDSQLSAKDEQEKIKKAGLPKLITVSTDMIGRGTDIKLLERTLKDGTNVSATDNGLNVMVTYLPRVRDLAQIIGRSGRFGAKGETSLILDKPHLLEKLGMKKLPQDFVRNCNAFIEREQAKMDRKAQAERLLKNHVGDFRMELQKNFFDGLLTK